MDNNYFTNVNPYFGQQDQGLSPVFQNIAAQQANQNMAMQQANQLTQQAGQTGQQGGMNPMAMASMLRKKDPKDATKPAPVTDYSQPMPNYMDPAYQQAGY
jgi:hypothetical protein